MGSFKIAQIKNKQERCTSSNTIDLRVFLDTQQDEACYEDVIWALKLIYGTIWRENNGQPFNYEEDNRPKGGEN